ncbi:MAG: phosphate acetyltransferase [Clostridiales bacterium]|jgi:phosphate acetyltransferase|nr:phosphate acetyltransferase [Clostridiales bacterium]
MSILLEEIRGKAKAADKKIILAEGEEPRTIEAAKKIAKEKITRVALVGNSRSIQSIGGNLEGIEIIDPATDKNRERYIDILYQARKSKGLTYEQAQELALDPLYYSVLAVKADDADGMVAGAVHSTSDTLRPALQIIKAAPGIRTVSSFFLMIIEGSKYGYNGAFLFADCGLNPNPDADQLAEIAVTSAQSAHILTGMDPHVAMLSFSTKGSAKHELVDKVILATQKAKELNPNLKIDGELQGDAALVESVAKLKCPDSEVAGKANVLIFPDLNAGNIAYKLVQRLANAVAIGPICQGFNKPVNDLSRGCTAEDIVDAVAITAVQATV